MGSTPVDDDDDPFLSWTLNIQENTVIDPVLKIPVYEYSYEQLRDLFMADIHEARGEEFDAFALRAKVLNELDPQEAAEEQSSEAGDK